MGRACSLVACPVLVRVPGSARIWWWCPVSWCPSRRGTVGPLAALAGHSWLLPCLDRGQRLALPGRGRWLGGAAVRRTGWWAG